VPLSDGKGKKKKQVSGIHPGGCGTKRQGEGGIINSQWEFGGDEGGVWSNLCCVGKEGEKKKRRHSLWSRKTGSKGTWGRRRKKVDAYDAFLSMELLLKKASHLLRYQNVKGGKKRGGGDYKGIIGAAGLRFGLNRFAQRRTS